MAKPHLLLELRQPMLVWDARIWARGKYAGSPGLQVKPDVGVKRWESHPEVHRVIDQWVKATRSDIAKAGIRLRRTKTSGKQYSALVCPACDSVMGQYFISRLLPEKWSILSGPTVPEPSPPVRQPGPASRPPARPTAVPHQLPPGRCDWCGKDPHPEYECLWRQFRARADMPAGTPHYSDQTYARIAAGEKAEDEGAAMLRRMLERCVAIPRRS